MLEEQIPRDVGDSILHKANLFNFILGQENLSREGHLCQHTEVMSVTEYTLTIQFRINVRPSHHDSGN